jgi:trigger factor
MAHPNEDEDEGKDFDTKEDFVFSFDLAFSPDVQIKLTKKNKMPYYKIIVDDDKINQIVEANCRQAGAYDESQEVTSEECFIKGILAELSSDGQPKEDGIINEDAALIPKYFTNQESKDKFIGASIGDKVVFNPKGAYSGSDAADAEIASLLGTTTEAVSEINSDFSFEISSVTKFVPAEINQDLFDSLYGKDEVTSEEEYRKRIADSLEQLFVLQSDCKLAIDMRPYLMEKAGYITLADDILKRKFREVEPNIKEEDREAEYSKLQESIKYVEIKKRIMADNNLKVTNENLLKVAKEETRNRFSQYGLNAPSDEIVAYYAQNLLKDAKDEALKFLQDAAVTDVIVGWLKETVSLQIKEMTFEEFKEKFESELGE